MTLLPFTATALCYLVTRREITAVEVCRACLDRIDRAGPRRCLPAICADRALRAALLDATLAGHSQPLLVPSIRTSAGADVGRVASERFVPPTMHAVAASRPAP
jgi:hypothetical protein